MAWQAGHFARETTQGQPVCYVESDPFVVATAAAAAAAAAVVVATATAAPGYIGRTLFDCLEHIECYVVMELAVSVFHHNTA